MLSNCCNQPMNEELEICEGCYEHCEAINELKTTEPATRQSNKPAQKDEDMITDEMLSGDSYQDFAPMLDESEQIAIDRAEERADLMESLYERSLEQQVASNSWRS